MVALFLDDNKTTDDGDAKDNGKNNMFILTNNNFARASRYFVHFFAVVAAYDMKLLNFTSPLYGVGEHNTKIGAFFFVSPNIAWLVLLMVAVVLKTSKQTNKQTEKQSNT